MSDTGYHKLQQQLDEMRKAGGLDGKTITLIVALLGTNVGQYVTTERPKAVEDRVAEVYREQMEKAEASAERAWCFYGGCRQGLDAGDIRRRCAP